MLNIDKFFYKAINTTAINALVSGRIFNPARTEAEEEADRIPYLIITYDGGSAGGDTEDLLLASLTQATVSILCVADDRDALATLTEKVEAAVEKAFADEIDDNSWKFRIESATESASGVNLDPSKPCCYQTLTYQCETAEK